MQDLLGAECDLAEILCVYSLHKNLSGLSEGIYRIGLICGGGGCERACKCAARRAGAASVEFDRNLCGSIFYAIFNHIYAILARLERKRCGFFALQLLGFACRLRLGRLELAVRAAELGIVALANMPAQIAAGVHFCFALKHLAASLHKTRFGKLACQSVNNDAKLTV